MNKPITIHLIALIIIIVIILAVGIFAYVKSHNAIYPSGRHHGHRNRWGCKNSQWGCCNDGITTKKDPWGSNCTGRHHNRYGGDRDKHGCIGSAGYKWCHSLKKCIRPWEQSCP